MKKILLIDDDRIIRENMAELLQLSNYEVEVAADGKEGVEKAKSCGPDLIICDVMMPELDGYSVLHLLGKEQETASIPFVFLTARTEKSDVRRGMNMGADDFITKPFQDIELLNAVESRLKKHDALKKQFAHNGSDVDAFLNEAGRILSQEEIAENYDKQKYRSRETLFMEGEHARFLYFVEEGQIKCYKLNEDGKEFITGIYGKGDFIGYKPLLEDRTYQEFAEVLENCTLFKIPKNDFLALIHKNHEVSDRFIKMLSKNLSEKEQELIEMAYSSVRKRTAHKIMALLDNEGGEEIRISRTNLARMVGTSKETLVRVLSEMKEDNIIHTEGPRIILVDKEKLMSLEKSW
ncbi:MAG: response regulator [Flavobacteriales bacterium]|nr:response regulator [Flavobacteriales bacterium]